MQKKTFYTELAYVIGIVVLAFGTALMEKADLGMSMVVAPAYLLHLKISQVLPFYSFGMSEYVFQAFLLVVLSFVLHRFKRAYLFSFVTALFYGFVLDGIMGLIAGVALEGIALRVVFYAMGLVICSAAINLLFNTYLPPEAYEVFVKEISDKTGVPISKTKTAYDVTSCAISVVMSFAFFGFGQFEGVKVGTIFCALVNGWLIGRFGLLTQRFFEFRDAFPWRERFSK